MIPPIENPIEIIDLEANPTLCKHLAARSQRERLSLGMFVRVHATQPGRTRPDKLWMRIAGGTWCGDIAENYIAEIAFDNSFLDVEIGHSYLIGPQHVCEWTTQQP